MSRPSDIRLRSIAITVFAVMVTGILVKQLPGTREENVTIESLSGINTNKRLPQDGAGNEFDNEIELHFKRAVVMLHARQYEYAVAALQKTLELAPQMPEAYVNMGYALLGLEQHAEAGEYFYTAIELRPEQANAYWGLAVSLEQSHDYDAAIGAMRTFIHLSDPAVHYLSKAQAAIWEWDELRKTIAAENTINTADPSR